MGAQDTEPRYVISVAAKIVGIEAHTLRYYEKVGLIQPHRSKGRVRYYSETDIDRLRHIKTMMDDMGVNLAGIEVIFRLMERMAGLQQNVRELEERLNRYAGTGPTD